MDLEIESAIDSEYENFVNNINNCTVFHSKKFLTFLESTLNESAKILTYKKNGEIQGVMPFFEKKNKAGLVINSLPFFGSYGGVLSDKKIVKKTILEYFNEYAKSKESLSTVIISNPFEKNEDYNLFSKYDIIEKRFTQYTDLSGHTEQDLFQNFEKRTRGAIKKAEKNNVTTTIENDNLNHFETFYNFYKNSATKKNIKIKPETIFSNISKNFESSKDFNIFVSWYDKKPIAYVLIFYHKHFAEYYIPAFDERFQNLQPISKTIWEAIKNAIKRKIKIFNFGGTPNKESTLYLFKRGWKSQDLEYSYFINRDLERLKDIGINKIKENFDNFFVIPYHELE